ncbi:unnamed protein product, partial [Prorocentrum cordatum]
GNAPADGPAHDNEVTLDHEVVCGDAELWDELVHADENDEHDGAGEPVAGAAAMLHAALVEPTELDDEPAAVDPPVPPPAVPAIVGPDGDGYFWRDGYKIGRITPQFRGSQGVKCYLHRACSLPIPIRKMPSADRVREWLEMAELWTPADTGPTYTAKRDAHMTALRRIRDEA